MSLIAELNEKKKKNTSNSKKRTVSLMQELSDMRRLQTVDVSGVNDEYISSFVTDANNFLSSSKEEFSSLGWGSASSTYDTKQKSWQELNKRSDAIKAWLYKNKKGMSEDSYNSLLDTVYNIEGAASSVLKNFEDANSFFSQFETEEAYNEWKKKEEEKKAILNAEDFEQYSQAGASIENPSYEDTQAPLDILGWKPFGDGEEVNNIVTFAEENYSKALAEFATNFRGGRSSSYQPELILLINQFMTDEEKSIYNYYIGKGDTEKANEYITRLTDALRQRQAGKIVEQADGNALELVFSAVAGLDQFATGVKNIDNYLMGKESDPKTAIQYAQGEMSANNEGVWKVANDAISTTSNMLPSILVGSVTGGVGGIATMTGSAVGNAYSDMRDLGYEDWQAAGYATLVGASEALLEKFIGGFSSIGGKHSLSAAIKKTVSGIDNAFARLAIQVPLNMTSEAAEEMLQTVLEPVFKRVMTGEDFEPAQLSDILYSGLLGAISAGAIEGVGGSIGAVGSSINAHKYNKIYGADSQALVSEALEIDPENAHAMKMQEKLNQGKSLSGFNIEHLVDSNEQALVSQDKAKINAKAKEMLAKYGETSNIEKIAEVITKIRTGEKISKAESDILTNSTYGRRVSTELNPDIIEAGTHTTDWTEDIGTERINADLYNRSGEKTTHQPENKLHTNIISPDDEEKEIEVEIEAPANVSGSITNIPENVSVDNIPVVDSAEQEESNISLEDASKKYGAQAQAMIHTYREGQDVIRYDSAYKTAYDMGKNGVSLSYAMNSEATAYLSEAQRELAYEAGKAAAEKSSLSLKLDTNSDIIEKTEDSNENGESVHLRKGGQRTGGTDTEGQISRVEDGSGQNQSRQNARRAADSKATKLVNEGREVTVASLGIAGGSESHKVRLVESESETASMKKARETAEERGLKVKFFVGNNLIINDKKGGVISARAYILGNQMLVRADHPYYTSEQLVRHEVGHDKIAKSEVNITKVRERLEETVGKENIDSVAELYAEAYDGSGLTADEIWEECICDSLGDMNIFAKDAEISEFMGNMLSEIKTTAESESKSPTQTRGSPDGKTSRETSNKKPKYISYSKVGQANIDYINRELRSLYHGITDGIADEIAIENGNKVFIVDSGTEKGRISFGVRRMRTVSNSIAREKFIRSQNNDAKSKGYISDGLLERFGDGRSSDFGRNLRRESGAELQADIGKSEDKQSGISRENADNRGLNGKASRETYWYPKLSQREWSLLNSKLDKELESSDNFIDKATKWIYADVKGVKVFAIYGIGNGTEATVLYAVGGKRAQTLNDRRLEYESNINRTERNPYKKNLDRLGLQQYQYGNGINRDGQNEPGSTKGIGSVSSGTQRGNNGGTVSNDSGQGKASRELAVEENYTEEEYNNFGWARENEVLSAKENERLRSLFADAVSKQANPPKTKSGEYMIAIGEDVDNKIAYMKGEIDSPVITRILEIDEYNETKLNELRRETYALERRGIQQETGGIFYTYTSASFGRSDNQQGSGIQSKRYNYQFGTERGRGSKTTSRVKEILFDDEGNEISRSYSDEQYQQRSEGLTDREVLELAANEVKVSDLTQAENDALTIFQDRLANLKDLQEKRVEQGRLYKEQQFGAKPDRAESSKTLNRMKILDEQIKKATADVLTVEEKEVLKRVLNKARKVVEEKERQHGLEILNRWRDRRNNAAAIKKYRDRLGLQQYQYGNGINRDGQNEPGSTKGIGSVSSGTQRGNNGGTVSNDSGQGKDSRELAVEENYTEEEYNNFGWVRANEVISEGYWKNFTSNFAQAVETLQKYPKTKSGDFMISVYDVYDSSEVADVVVFAKGFIESPNVTKIVKFNLDSESEIYPKRRNLYETERRGIRQKAGEIFDIYYKADFVGGRRNERNSSQSVRNNNRLNSKRRRSEIEANPITQFNVNEYENTVTYTYANGEVVTESLEKTKFSRELDFIDYINENAEAEEHKSNRELLANALESVTVNDVETKRLAQYKANIAQLNTQSEKLSLLKRELKELSFSEGSRDTVRIRELRDEIIKTENRINIYDEKLLNLEATKPLSDVLEREKKKAYDKAKQKGKEALEAQRKRSEAKLSETKAQYREARARGIESRNKTAMRHKIKDVVSDLNKLLTSPTKDKHIPIELQKPVAEALSAVNMDTVGAEERIARLREEMLSARTPEAIQEIARKIENISQMGDRLDAKLSKLKIAYDSIINSVDPLVSNAHDEVISNTIEKVLEVVGDTPLRDMTLYQLETVYDMYRMVLHSISNANKAFKTKKGENIASLGDSVMEELFNQKKRNPLQTKVGEALSHFDWNNLKPVYAFERIGSKTLSEVFESVRAGEDAWAVDMTEAKEFFESQKKKHDYNSWNFDKRFEFKSSTEKEFSLSLGQILSLYAYSKRGNQAIEHLKNGGFVFDGLTKVKKNGIIYLLKDPTAYNLSDEILSDIISKLTPSQKAFADEMQDYLSTVMGEKGNEVSLALYGVKLFKEKYYFPLMSDNHFLERAREQAQGDVKIKNKGFTKETTPKAKNPIVLQSFMDVWSGHVNEMSMYHSFTLPLEDFYRVYNYKTSVTEDTDSESVISRLDNTHGNAAIAYIDQLLKDLNGGARSDPRESFFKALIANFKKASVIASLSVVIQQPSSIVRATALVNPKYFAGRKVSKSKHKETWAEVKKYAPVAIIKEMGYFDVGMGQSSVEWLKGDKTFGEKVGDVLSKAPSFADEYTWCAIWNAVKRETAAKNPSMATSSEEFLKIAGDRFTEVIVKTQVYDSTLSKSANMRSKSVFMSMLTSFMAEATTSLNMVQNAILSGNKARVISAVFGSVVLNSLLVSLVYAARDDDEDETYFEKYLSRFTTEIADGINPLTYIPFFKDIWSAAQGFDIERSEMSLITKVFDSLQQLIKVSSKDAENMSEEELSKYRESVTEAILSIVDNITALLGIPVKNIRRDINGIINGVKTLIKDANGRDTSLGSLADKILSDLKDSVPVWGWLPDESKGDKLYDAIIEGDNAYLERLKNGYRTENAYNSAVRQALRENDPRIKEAAMASMTGFGSERIRIQKEIIKEGHFKQDYVVEATNAEVKYVSAKINEAKEYAEQGKEDKFDKIYNSLLDRGYTEEFLDKIME